ncbi:MAG: ABC transporter permease subunit [Pseudomonadota bacterium]
MRLTLKSKYAWYGFGCVLIISCWQLAAWLTHPIIIPSPWRTMRAAFSLLGDPNFYFSHLMPSLLRIAMSITLGALTGFLLGLLAGFYRPLKWLLEPLRTLLMSLPAVVVAILAMLWFGLGTAMVTFTTAALIAPFLYLSTVNGVESIDRRYLEIASVYRHSRWTAFIDIVLPAISPSLFSGLSIVVANGLRLAVLAEVLGVNEGLGYLIATSRANLETDILFALVLIILVLVVGLDFASNHLLKRAAGMRRK